MGTVTASKWASWFKRWLFRWLRDGGRHFVTDQYRAAALRMMPHGTVVIPFPRLGPEHYKDPSHLNAVGRAILVLAIAEGLHGIIKNRP